MLDELEFHEIAAGAMHSGRGCVLIAAPNYEERSLGSTALFARLSENVPSAQVSALVFKFSSGLGPVLLDAVKEANSLRGIATLQSAGIERILLHPVRWPLNQESVQPLVSEVLSLCRDTAPCIDLFIDISALPRNLLLGLVESLLRDWSDSGVRTGSGSRIASVSIVYTPAKSYPQRYSDDLLGTIRGKYTSKRLDEFLHHTDNQIDLVLSLSGTGHDAAQVLGSMPIFGGANVQIRPFMFMSDDNIIESFGKFALNAWSIRQLRAVESRPNYLFGIEALSRHLTRDAITTAEKHALKGGDSWHYLLAGFGPKPIGFSCYLAKRVYDVRMRALRSWGTSDVLLTSGAQYSTIYSIGARNTRIWRLDIESLLDIG